MSKNPPTDERVVRLIATRKATKSTMFYHITVHPWVWNDLDRQIDLLAGEAMFLGKGWHVLPTPEFVGRI